MTLQAFFRSISRTAAPTVTAGLLGFAIAAKAAAWPAALGPGASALQALLASGESLLLAWVVLHPAPQALRRVAMAVFVAFSLVALATTLRGAESCGCFGRFAAPGWLTALLDAGIAAAWYRHAPGPGRWAWALPLAAAAGGIALALALPTAQRAVEPPRPEAASVPAALARGRWVVVAYRDDCPHCADELPGWIDAANRDSSPVRRWAFAAIGPPPGGPGLLDDAGLAPGILRLAWPELRIAPLPAAVRIVDGRIGERMGRPADAAGITDP